MPVFHPRALVSRLYMEYFSGGDLVDALSSRVYTYKSVPEEYVWRLIECLASAMLMLETGNEKLRPSATWRPWNHPIVHLDIKSDNSKQTFASSSKIGKGDANYGSSFYW